VRRLRDAGAVIVGKTNMSEFAFTGVGANPHFGTPGNPADRTRIPGGSSSGAAVSVADGMCEIAIGTDTGGSTRIPAGLCGTVGYKPSKYRIPTDGAFPLSPTLDSIGPIAKTVADCARADAIMAGEEPWVLQPASLGGLRFGIPQGLPLEELDQETAGQFEAAIGRLDALDVQLVDVEFPIFDDMARVNSIATIATAEAYQIHREHLASHGSEFDPLVRARIEMGRAVSNEDYAKMIRDRGELVRSMDAMLSDLDVLILPTTPIVAPTFTEISTPDGFQRANRLLLRNTAIANFFDLCAISIPIGGGPMPVGLMLFARRGHDRRLFSIAAAIETLRT